MENTNNDECLIMELLIEVAGFKYSFFDTEELYNFFAQELALLDLETKLAGVN
ncbi:hypothetical protein [Listeria ilorinensis]|uniref:hypothetical protein n=1 Tax=Listeria ilorinensis TaxID=2867439 RepID=UPI001EF742A8|nr:hypothetical protein [Listeria ilorinensis]